MVQGIEINMTTAEHLWNDINHIRKMEDLCYKHELDIYFRWKRNELTQDRYDELRVSALDQYNRFSRRRRELEKELLKQHLN